MSCVKATPDKGLGERGAGQMLLIGNAVHIFRIPRVPAGGLRALLADGAQHTGAKLAAARGELCLLRLVGRETAAAHPGHDGRDLRRGGCHRREPAAGDTADGVRRGGGGVPRCACRVQILRLLRALDGGGPEGVRDGL